MKPPQTTAADAVKTLIERGADIHARTNNQFYTPLHCAVAEPDSIEAVRVLLDHDADVHLKSGKGTTPLDVAMNARNADAVKLLVEKGAGITSGHSASTPSHVETLNRGTPSKGSSRDR